MKTIVNYLWLHWDFHGECEVSLEFWLLSSIIKQVFCQLECQTCHLTTEDFLSMTQCSNYSRILDILEYRSTRENLPQIFSFSASYGMFGLNNLCENTCEPLKQCFCGFGCVFVLVRESQEIYIIHKKD